MLACAERSGASEVTLGADRVKIGIAADPVARLAALQTACPHPLSLLLRLPATRELESALHARLADFHLGGEWFAWRSRSAR